MAKKTTSLTSTEKRKLDNIVNKINKRLVHMVKTGMYSSQAYTDITNQLVTLGGKLVMQKLKSMGYTQAPASGIGGLFNHPIKWETVYDPSGAPVRVPQLSRASWVLEGSRSSLTAIEAVGTGLGERVAAEDYYRRAYGTDPTDEDIQRVMENQAERNDMLSYIWDYLYGMKHIQEVQDFFSSIPKHYDDADEADRNNQIAMALYNKYRSQVDESKVRKKPLSTAQKAYLYGTFDKRTGKRYAGVAERSMQRAIDAINNGTPVQQVKAVEEWIGWDRASGSYGDSGLVEPYKPTVEEIEQELDFLKQMSEKMISPVPERWKKK